MRGLRAPSNSPSFRPAIGTWHMALIGGCRSKPPMSFAPKRHPLADLGKERVDGAERPNQAADSSLPSTRRRVSIFVRVRVRVREHKISAMLLPAVFSRVRGSGFGTPLWVGRRKPTHRGHPRKSSVPDSVRERHAQPPATRKGATARAVTPRARETRLKVKD